MCDGSDDCDGWELDQQLQHIERMLRSGSALGPDGASLAGQALLRADSPHAVPPQGHFQPADSPGHGERLVRGRSRSLAAKATWIALLLGTAGLFCGGILLASAVVVDREDLWSVGMPIALLGQIVLLIGLALQLERLRHHSRHTAAKLDNVDEQLSDLKTTAMSGPGPGLFGGGPRFPSVLGAGPREVLDDLKKQLELLARKIDRAQL